MNLESLLWILLWKSEISGEYECVLGGKWRLGLHFVPEYFAICLSYVASLQNDVMLVLSYVT